MIEVYRDLLILTCICLLGWGVIRTERIYQYPFFMGSIFISFLLPQVFALISNPGVVSQEALERVLLVSSLCAAACWVGYERKPNRKWLATLNVPLDEHKLYKAGIFLMVQGYFFSFLLSTTDIERLESRNWTGAATIYIFFSKVIYIAFGIFLLQCLKNPNIINFIFTTLASIPLVQTILVGRRQATMTFLIIIGLSFWLVRRYVPPRLLVITSALMLTIIIPVVGALRNDFWDLLFGGNWQALLSASQDSFGRLQEGKVLELRNAALFMDAVEKQGVYGYGTGFWDAIVFQYVPGQIVGYEFKASLQFQMFKGDLLTNLYGYSVPKGTTVTGVGDSFMEFGYLGCLIFAIIGYLFKNLWISSVYFQSTISRLLYMGLVSPAMVGLTHGIGRLLQELIFQIIFITLVAYYSRTRYKYPDLETVINRK